MNNIKNKNSSKISFKNNEENNNLSEIKFESIQLKKEILLYKKENEKISKMRDYMFELLEETQKKLADEEIKHKKDLFVLKEEIKKTLQENTKLKSKIKNLKLKGKRCDELEYNLNSIKEKIKFDYYNLIEESECAAKDAMDVILDMINCTCNFTKNIKQAKKDIKIGKHTLQDIIIILEKDSKQCLDQLNKIKENFNSKYRID